MAALASPSTERSRRIRVGSTDAAGGREVRADLERQIARLERRHAALVAAAWPRAELLAELAVPQARGRGPRLASVAELERTRDELIRRVLELERALDESHERERQMRELRRRMFEDPASCPGALVTNRDCGEPGCTRYRVVPRLGLLGLVLGWWRVKVSSGCPLAEAPVGAELSPR